MLLGKFMPPHKGHEYLIDFARGHVDQLTVLIYSIERDPIPGQLRHRWLRAMFPDVEITHVSEDLPQAPEEHPDFWPIWKSHLHRLLPALPDYVFASEPYGFRLAEILAARYVPVDHDRLQVPVSATDIRRDPVGHWQYIPRPVRPYYARRVCIFGPESTGKTTLARRLAERYETVCVLEYARPLLDFKAGRCDREDIQRIARGQIASEDALAYEANRVLICDTDVLTTMIWSEVLFGECPPWVADEAERRRYDLYLLLDVDIPWVDDGQRFLRAERRDLFERYRRALASRERPYVTIRGEFEERLAAASRAIDCLLQNGGVRLQSDPASPTSML